MRGIGAGAARSLRWLFVSCYLGGATLPLVWMMMTSVKSKEDSISLQPRFIPVFDRSESDAGTDRLAFHPTLAGYARLGLADASTGRSFHHYLGNSLVIGLISTAASVLIGTLCAYGFSRFPIPGARDWLFFILSTRFLPPLAVVVPVLMMYREFDLQGTHLGLRTWIETSDQTRGAWAG